MLCILSH